MVTDWLTAGGWNTSISMDEKWPSLWFNSLVAKWKSCRSIRFVIERKANRKWNITSKPYENIPMSHVRCWRWVKIGILFFFCFQFFVLDCEDVVRFWTRSALNVSRSLFFFYPKSGIDNYIYFVDSRVTRSMYRTDSQTHTHNRNVCRWAVGQPLPECVDVDVVCVEARPTSYNSSN